MDAHIDALDKLHEALTDKIASRYKKPKPGEEEKKPGVVEISVTKAEPGGEPDGDEPPDEVPPEEAAHSPGASAALEALRFIRKHGRK